MAGVCRVRLMDPVLEKPEPSGLRPVTDQVSIDEDEATELALQIACEDPTEKNHLASTTIRARDRLKAAAAEMVRAAAALLFAWLAQLLLTGPYKKVTERRGVVGRAERGVLALQHLLSGFLVRRLIGRRRLLRMLGASRRTDDEGGPVYSLKLAERRYRIREGMCSQGHVTAADSPTVRVLIGVGIASDGEPVWCLKRFVRTETGSWSALYSGYEADAESVLIVFYGEPSPIAAAGSVEEAPVEGATVESQRIITLMRAGGTP